MASVLYRIFVLFSWFPPKQSHREGLSRKSSKTLFFRRLEIAKDSQLSFGGDKCINCGV